MISLTVLRQWLTQTIVPVLAGAAANWLMIHVHFLAAFHADAGSIAGVLSQVGVFVVGAGLAWAASHHILAGTYKSTPAPPAPSSIEDAVAVIRSAEQALAGLQSAPVVSVAPAQPTPAA